MTKKGAIATPAKVIATHYPLTKKVPFGAGGTLVESQVVSKIELVRAALECGYGKRGLWTSKLALRPSECQRLQRHLLLRHEFVASCIGIDSRRGLSPLDFVQKLEKSELAALSFLVGQYGTFLAAKRWLDAAGQQLSGFLHCDLYSKALVPTTFSATSESRPDFLVATKGGDWHLFESKGGSSRDRWPALAKGLQQLDVVAKLGWMGSTPVSPTSRVCVHTTFVAGAPFEVTVVDPPTVNGELQDSHRDLLPDRAVCRALIGLDTIDAFRALTAGNGRASNRTEGDWRIGSSQWFGGLTVALPSNLLKMERAIRARLSTYLSFREIADGFVSRGEEPSWASILASVLQSPGRGPAATSSASKLVRLAINMRDQQAESRTASSFFENLVMELELPSVVARASEEPPVPAWMGEGTGSWVRTSGGMLLFSTGVQNALLWAGR